MNNQFRLWSGNALEKGISLIEMLVTLLIVSIFMGAASSQFLDSVTHAHDHSVISRTEEQLRTITDTIAFDLRMTGSGMPLGQSNLIPQIVC